MIAIAARHFPPGHRLPSTRQLAMQTGLQGHRVVGICSQAGHYSNQTIAGWLGIGTENLIAIPTDDSLAMRIDLLESTADALLGEGRRVAYVCGTFGTTDGFGVDDLPAIRRVMETLCHKHGVPMPQIHADAAVGWAMTMLTDYDRQANPLAMSPRLLEMVAQIQQKNTWLRAADSVTIDFHKMGLGHYPASAFIVNRREDLKYLARNVRDTPYFSEADPRRDPALFTLECSRPGIGPYSVIASLNGIGLRGWQMLVARSLELADHLKDRLSQLEYCKVLNRGTIGPSVNWWVLPKGRNAEEVYGRWIRNELTEEQRQRYQREIRQLFEIGRAHV